MRRILSAVLSLLLVAGLAGCGGRPPAATVNGAEITTADLQVEADVELTGVGPRFDGHYRLVEVRHRFDAEAGLRTEITAERPGLGSPA